MHPTLFSLRSRGNKPQELQPIAKQFPTEVPQRMKLSNLLNLVLIVVTFAGMYHGYGLHTEHKRLHEELASLSSSFGDFSQEPDSSPQIIRLNTNDPMVFQWRVYLPPGYSGEVIDRCERFGSPLKIGHKMPWTYPAEFLITQKFEVQRNSEQAITIRSNIHCTNWAANQSGPVNYTSGQGSSRPMLQSRLSGNRGSLSSKFVADHWDDLVFEMAQAGNSSVLVEETDLFKVAIPDELMKDYLATNPSSRKGKSEDVLKDLYLEVKKSD